jgi:hypothetical protein
LIDVEGNGEDIELSIAEGNEETVIDDNLL